MKIYSIHGIYTIYICLYWVSIEPAKRKAIRHAILESTRTAVIFLQLKQTSFSTYSRLWSCLLSHLSAERLRLVKEKVGKCMLNKCGNRNFSSDCRDRFKLFMYLIFVAFPFLIKKIKVSFCVSLFVLVLYLYYSFLNYTLNRINIFIIIFITFNIFIIILKKITNVFYSLL